MISSCVFFRASGWASIALDESAADANEFSSSLGISVSLFAQFCVRIAVDARNGYVVFQLKGAQQTSSRVRKHCLDSNLRAQFTLLYLTCARLSSCTRYSCVVSPVLARPA
jgi:hypothetical protein